MKSRKSVLITDLDNTLFDWVQLWHACFSAMLDKIIEISGVSEAQLKSEIRAVHRKHGTSEYAFLIEEIPSLRKKYPKEDLLHVFAPALSAYREERRKKLSLYPTVAESLLKIKGTGAKIVGYTESMAFYSNYRVRRLGLDGVFDVIFSPKDHGVPKGMSKEQIRKYPATQYDLKFTRHEHTPEGELKPNKDILLSIIKHIHALPEDCIYIGDSLFKDVAMAKDAGVSDVWASYGQSQSTSAYQLLREVTHWSDADVEREKKILQRGISSSLELKNSFNELFDAFKFGSGGSYYEITKTLPLSSDDKKNIIDIWKTIVEVQQHFNDIEMRIRSVLVSLVLASGAAFGFLIDKNSMIEIGEVKIQYALLVPIFGIIGTFLFYFMDRHWYHRLLLGSVKHGLEIEKKYAAELPELALTDAIGRESPVKVRGWLTQKIANLVVSNDFYKKNKILRSDSKIEFFYKSIVLLFTFVFAMTLLFGGMLINNKGIIPGISAKFYQVNE